jgi:hypothetical protein
MKINLNAMEKIIHQEQPLNLQKERNSFMHSINFRQNLQNLKVFYVLYKIDYHLYFDHFIQAISVAKLRMKIYYFNFKCH